MAVGSLEMEASSAGEYWRRGKRMPLHRLVQLIRMNGAVLPAKTENLSGIYYQVKGCFAPGEEFDCDISTLAEGKWI